ncbi:MAG: hypothetical protein QGG40_07520 [Myxococcota bacterium]|jgi:hypothetical protein|nr:hypothetical protein [Myxococcota bacterium]
MLTALTLSTALFAATPTDPTLTQGSDLTTHVGSAQPWTASLDVARQLRDSQDSDSARGVLEWILGSDAPAEIREQAQALLEGLPLEQDWETWEPMARLVGWQTAAGAWVGLTPVFVSPVWIPDGIALASVLTGATAGAASSVVYGKRSTLTPGRASTIITAQQLGAFHGAGLSLLADERGTQVPLGITTGALLGTGVGYHLASRDPSDAMAIAAHSGMFWGAGLGAGIMGATYAFGYSSLTDVLPLVAAADLGALGYSKLTQKLELDRAQVRLANMGGVAGALTTLSLMAVTSDIIWWSPGVAVGGMTAGALGGAVAGISLSQHFGAPAPSRHGTVSSPLAQAMPTPSVLPTDDGLVPALVASARF